MGKINTTRFISVNTVRQANERLKSTGVVVTSVPSKKGSISVFVERGTFNYRKLISTEEINKAYRTAIEEI